MTLSDLITVTAATIEITDEFGNVLYKGHISKAAHAIPQHLGRRVGGIVLANDGLLVWIFAN